MSVTYPSSVIDSRLQVVVDAIDSGAGSGILQLGTAGMGSVLSNITLAKPCATIASGVLTFAGTPITDPAAAGLGAATAARIQTSAGDTVISGLTVSSAAGSNILISRSSIAIGDIVTFLSGTITGA